MEMTPHAQKPLHRSAKKRFLPQVGTQRKRETKAQRSIIDFPMIDGRKGKESES
jgi:hypothetical protein